MLKVIIKTLLKAYGEDMFTQELEKNNLGYEPTSVPEGLFAL